MKRLLPKGLAGQMVIVLVLALAVAQAVAVVLFVGARDAAVQALRARDIATRMESLVDLLTTVPREIHGDVLDAVNADRARFRIASEPSVCAGEAETASRLQDDLRRRLAPHGVEKVQIKRRGRSEFVSPPPPKPLRPAPPPPRPPPGHESAADEPRPPPPPPPMPPRLQPSDQFATQVAVSAQLPSGEWINAEFYSEPQPPVWSVPGFAGTVLAAAAIFAVVVVMVRRLSRPLSELAGAADRLGRGQDAAPLPETGPDEVRRTVHAFNTMTVRLRRFIEGQTRMLAAISHDLKTPITSLRIRTEFVEAGENREKMLATIEDMQRITEATLAFARDDTAREPSRRVDLSALMDSVCADLRDIGADVTLNETASLPFTCKPNGLRRAIRNLVENAVKHGVRARVSVEAATDSVLVIIDDDGPGIAVPDHERVFEPFVRLEESRSPETGGIGLGLSIARSIIQAHGGDITLANRKEGGLRVEVTLPRGGERDGDE